jgi:hypothetical protein
LIAALFLLSIPTLSSAQQKYDDSAMKQIKDKRTVALEEARSAYNASKAASAQRALDRMDRSIDNYKETAMGWKANVEREKVRRMAVMDESYENGKAAEKYEAEKQRIEKEYKEAVAKEEVKKKQAEAVALERRREAAVEKFKNSESFKKQQEDLKAREKALAEDEKRLAEQRKQAAEIAKKEKELKEREDRLNAEKGKLAKEYDPKAAEDARKKRDEEIQKEVDRRNKELRETQQKKDVSFPQRIKIPISQAEILLPESVLGAERVDILRGNESEGPYVAGIYMVPGHHYTSMTEYAGVDDQITVTIEAGRQNNGEIDLNQLGNNFSVSAQLEKENNMLWSVTFPSGTHLWVRGLYKYSQSGTIDSIMRELLAKIESVKRGAR